MVKGLSFRKTADAVAAFVKEHGHSGPRRAVLCTYDLHPDRFEAVMLPELTRRRRWFRTLVLADGAALQKDGVLGHQRDPTLYELAPVRLRGPGVFHPKLLVLQAGDRALVGIGSANLTPGGLGGNLELMLFAADDSADGRALAASTVQFLDELRRTDAVVMPTSARRFLERLCVSRPRSQSGPVLHSLVQPLLAQMGNHLPSRMRRAVLISPWHSSSASADGVEPAVLSAFGRTVGTRPMVHTEGVNGRGPDLGKRVRVRVLKTTTIESADVLDIDAEDVDDTPPPPRRPATLHAKAYLAVGERTATLWYGSANCTRPALLETATGRGNVELLARATLSPRAVAALDADLHAMFEDRTGVLPPKPKVWIAAPRGCVLSGYVSRWRTQQRMTLEVVASENVRSLRLGRTPDRKGSIKVMVSRGATSVALEDHAISKLLDGDEVPSALWEHVDATAVPFPVSMPCIPIADGAEMMLEDLLDDLAGRPPVTLAPRRRRPEIDDVEDVEDEGDRELELLTKTEHEGCLDRLAVRVELLRKRLAAAGWHSTDSRAHYRGVIERLPIAPSLRRILVDHLGASSAAR